MVTFWSSSDSAGVRRGIWKQQQQRKEMAWSYSDCISSGGVQVTSWLAP